MYAVTERRTSEDYLRRSDLMEGAIDELEATGNRGDGLAGVPTGFAELDRLTNGFHSGQMIYRRQTRGRQGARARYCACDSRRAGPRWARLP